MDKALYGQSTTVIGSVVISYGYMSIHCRLVDVVCSACFSEHRAVVCAFAVWEFDNFRGVIKWHQRRGGELKQLPKSTQMIMVHLTRSLSILFLLSQYLSQFISSYLASQRGFLCLCR